MDFSGQDRVGMRIDDRPDVSALESVERCNEAARLGSVVFFTMVFALMLGMIYYVGKRALTGQMLTLLDAAYVLVISAAIVSLRLSPLSRVKGRP